MNIYVGDNVVQYAANGVISILGNQFANDNSMIPETTQRENRFKCSAQSIKAELLAQHSSLKNRMNLLIRTSVASMCWSSETLVPTKSVVDKLRVCVTDQVVEMMRLVWKAKVSKVSFEIWRISARRTNYYVAQQ